MTNLQLNAPVSSHLLKVVRALLGDGWVIESAPEDGRLARNGQKILLQSDRLDLRFRLFVYKVTGSGRGRPDERRIEITNTYKKGLKRVSRFPDIVLGYDPSVNLFVGVDSERIKHGGRTGNASSFFDIAGLTQSRTDGIAVSYRRANLFPKGIEYHAFISPEKLPEYFFNRESIHAGTYAGDGDYSGKSRRSSRTGSESFGSDLAGGDVLGLRGPSVTRRSQSREFGEGIITALERGQFPRTKRTKKKISPERFLELKRIMAENGLLGEEYVINAERRRLRRAGLAPLAAKVQWISQESVGEGYDIVSYETDGSKRFIEVKSSVSRQRTFDMSDNEWRTACELGDSYYICRVTSVRSKPSVSYFRNPQQLEQEGKVQKIASGWRVTLL
jgi:hypothetical protein